MNQEQKQKQMELLSIFKQHLHILQMLKESEDSVPEDEARYRKYTVSLESASHEFVAIHAVKPDRTLRKELLEKALDKLSTKQRQIVWLTAVNQMSQSDVAKICGCSQKNISYHYNKAIQQLKMLLRNSAIERKHKK